MKVKSYRTIFYLEGVKEYLTTFGPSDSNEMENLLFEAGVMGSKVVKQFRLKGIYNTFMKGGGGSV